VIKVRKNPQKIRNAGFVTACVEGIGEGGIAGGVTAGHITDLQ
jgi:hypothetical protein